MLNFKINKKLKKNRSFLYFYIKDKMNNLFQRLYSLFKICCTNQEPASPAPYRRKLPRSNSTYKTVSFNTDQKYRGITL